METPPRNIEPPSQGHRCCSQEDSCTDKGANPTVTKCPTPWRGSPHYSGGSSKPRNRETENQGIIPTSRRGPDSNALEKAAPRSPGGESPCQGAPRTPRGCQTSGGHGLGRGGGLCGEVVVAAEAPGLVPALTQRQAAGGAHGRPEAVHLRVLLAVRLPHHLALQDLLAAGPRLLGHGCGGGGVPCAGTGNPA